MDVRHGITRLVLILLGLPFLYILFDSYLRRLLQELTEESRKVYPHQLQDFPDDRLQVWAPARDVDETQAGWATISPASWGCTTYIPSKIQVGMIPILSGSLQLRVLTVAISCSRFRFAWHQDKLKLVSGTILPFQEAYIDSLIRRYKTTAPHHTDSHHSISTFHPPLDNNNPT